MARSFLQILIYFLICIICPSKSINSYSENLSTQGYDILDFNDQNTTVSKYFEIIILNLISNLSQAFGILLFQTNTLIF